VAAVPIMQKQKLGHIINISSVAGFKVFAPGGTVYGATKFAMRALTEGLRMEHKADNIRCTMTSPGAVDTELPGGSSVEAASKNCASSTKWLFPPCLNRLSRWRGRRLDHAFRTREENARQKCDRLKRIQHQSAKLTKRAWFLSASSMVPRDGYP
jgi:NAD(P)-dependent dehydrogenase (short-subunit alcohol dehydrogenase family)